MRWYVRVGWARWLQPGEQPWHRWWASWRAGAWERLGGCWRRLQHRCEAALGGLRRWGEWLQARWRQGAAAGWLSRLGRVWPGGRRLGHPWVLAAALSLTCYLGAALLPPWTPAGVLPAQGGAGARPEERAAPSLAARPSPSAPVQRRPSVAAPGPGTVSPRWVIPVQPGDVDLLARLIEAEAQGEPFTGMVAVGAVVVNRVHSGLFANTVSGVVFEPWAFEAVANGLIWQRTPSAEAYRAARLALAGYDPTGGALYYWNPVTAVSPWVWSRPVITQIGQHVFAV